MNKIEYRGAEYFFGGEIVIVIHAVNMYTKI